MPRARAIDPIDLEIFWSRLVTVVDEAAFAIMRTSMSKVVMEGRDFGAVICDPETRMLVADESVSSKAGTTPAVVRETLKEFPPETLRPGDVLANNNPWWGLGHLNDVSVMSPIFYKKRLVGYAQTMAHMADIGGSLSGRPREVYEEGLIIPAVKIVDAGRENDTFFRMLGANVRIPEAVSGDIRALIAGLRVIEDKTCAFLELHGMRDLSRVGGAILKHSEARVRSGIAASIPDGEYRGSTTVDGFDEPLTIAVRVKAKGGHLEIDYEGTSPQSGLGINSTWTYTTMWSKFTIKCLVAPDLPNNAGTFAPIDVTAPAGCFLNPTFPAPVKMKPSTGHYIPIAVLNALTDVVPERMLAESGNKFLVYMAGRDPRGAPISDMMFVMGGMGARANKDGLNAIGFPANASNLPIEVMENTIPVRVRQKRLRTDSGGAGRYRGGCGQVLEFESTSTAPLTVRAEHGKLSTAPLGLRGGLPGATGGVFVNDREMPDKLAVILERGDVMRLLTPGSGGASPPSERDPQALQDDIDNGLVSAEAAARDYAVQAKP